MRIVRECDENLLTRFYDELLVPNFGMHADELEPLYIFKKVQSNYKLFVTLLLEDQDIIGGCVFEFYPKSKCGLLTYIAIKPQHRNKGLSRILVDEALNQLGNINAIFLETNADTVSIDVMKPSTRRMILYKLGFRPIHIDYVQPPLSNTTNKCHHLILARHCKGHQDNVTVIDWLTEYYQVLMGDAAETDPDLLKMIHLLKNNPKL